MKKIILLLLIVFTSSLYSQSVRITGIDASNYPEVLVEFQAYDENGDQYRTFDNTSTTITDSGVQKSFSDIECETRGTKFSLILQLDVSASMAWGVGSSDTQNAPVGDRRWDAIIDAVDLMFNSLDQSSNEVSIMLFSTTSVKKLPFSQDFNALRTEIRKLKTQQTLQNSTDFNAALIGVNNRAAPRGDGAVQFTPEARWKPVIIVLTDGEHSMDVDGDVQTGWIQDTIDAMGTNPIIYGMSYGQVQSGSLTDVAAANGGSLKSNFTGEDQVYQVFDEIIQEVNANPAALPPCELTYQASCDGGEVIISVNINGVVVSDTLAYTVPSEVLPNLAIDNRTPIIMDVADGATGTTVVNITAENNYVDFNGAPTFSDPRFTVLGWNNARLNKDESRAVTIQYTGNTERACIPTTMTFQSTACSGNEMTPQAGYIVAQDVTMSGTTIGSPIQEQKIAFCNYSCKQVVLNNITFQNRDAGDFSYVDAQNIIIAPNECRQLMFEFNPTGSGNRGADMIVTVDSKEYQAEITGGGTGLPEIVTTVSNDGLVLDCAGDTGDITIEVTNAGPVPLNINDNVTLSDNTNFTISQNLTSVPGSNGTGDIIITYNPQAPGNHPCDVTITSDAKNEPVKVVSISGRLNNHDFDPMVTSYDFGFACPNTATDVTVFFENSGDVDNTLTLSSASADISFPNGNTLSLDNTTPDFNITLQVNSPDLGAFSQVISVEDECGNIKDLTITGTIEVSTVTRNETTKVIAGLLNTPAKESFVIDNSSNQDISNLTFTVLPPNNADFIIDVANTQNSVNIGGNFNLAFDFTLSASAISPLEIQVSGDPCVDQVLTFDINPGLASAEFFTDDQSALVGQTIQVTPVINDIAGFYSAGVANVSAELRVNKFVLQNTDAALTATTDGDDLVLFIDIDPSNPQPIEFVALSGIDGNTGDQLLTSKIEFIFDNTDPVGIANVNDYSGTFSLILARGSWELENYEQNPGQNFKFVIGMKDLDQVSTFHEAIVGEIEFNATMMAPVGDTDPGTIDQQTLTRRVPFVIEINDNSIEKGDGIQAVSAGPILLDFKALLGNEVSTTVSLVNLSTRVGDVQLDDDNNFSTLTLLNVCENENGEVVRLFDPTFQAANIDIGQSNIISRTTDVSYTVLEHGTHSIKLIDMSGNISNVILDRNMSPGTYHTVLDPSKLSNGVYLIYYKTPTQEFTKKIQISK